MDIQEEMEFAILCEGLVRENKLSFHNKRQESIKNYRHHLERYFGLLFNQSRECYEKLDCIPDNERWETDWVSKIAEYISSNPARITELVLKDMLHR